MSTTMSPALSHVTKLSRGSGDEDLAVFANAAIVAGTELTLWMRDEDDDHVLITLGQERLTLEFYDVEGAEHLYELLGEAVRFLGSRRRTVSG